MLPATARAFGRGIPRPRSFLRPAAFCTALLIHVAFIVCAQEQPLPRILIINSYHYGYDWSDKEMEGILAGLHKRWPILNVDVEFLDTKRRPDPANLEEMAEVIRMRYASVPHDVIVTTDDLALLFALDHTDLFSETPIVFCGFNGYPLEELTTRTNVTAIVETFDTRGLLEFATEILPDLDGIFVVHDATELGEITRQEIERVAADFTDRLEFAYSYSKTIDVILSQVDALNDDWAILYSGLIRNASGVVLPSFYDMQRRMAARTDAPLFYISGGSVGLGDSENIHNTGIHHGGDERSHDSWGLCRRHGNPGHAGRDKAAQRRVGNPGGATHSCSQNGE